MTHTHFGNPQDNVLRVSPEREKEKKLEKILVLDFGGQYNQLIARRVRDMNVYAEIIPYNKITVGEIVSGGYKGIIFTGGPNSV